ncbi:MAG: hypothetical protein ACI88A_000217 [Paraglaciecola sp.]|jgi:hypothetical protein
MPSTLSFQNRSGSYKMERHNNIVICTLEGAMGVSMAKRYLANLNSFAQQFNQIAWGFVASASEYQGAAPGAEEYLSEAYTRAIRQNCKSDAYCMTSPMAIAQLAKLRQQCNLPGAISRRVYSTIEHAITLVKKELSAITTDPVSNN